MTGSIAAYRAGDIIRRLQDKGFQVSVIMTKEAEKFITPLTLACLSGKEVFRDMFHGEQERSSMGHIELARTADCLLIAPATANTIAKLAHGFADDILTCVALATRAPLCIAPAMNDLMYQNPAVQENCAKLKKNGIKFVDPTKGKLACGVYGEGHLADVENIIESVVRLLHEK